MIAIFTSTNVSALFRLLQAYLLYVLLPVIQAHQAQAQDGCAQISIKLITNTEAKIYLWELQGIKPKYQ